MDFGLRSAQRAASGSTVDAALRSRQMISRRQHTPSSTTKTTALNGNEGLDEADFDRKRKRDFRTSSLSFGTDFFFPEFRAVV